MSSRKNNHFFKFLLHLKALMCYYSSLLGSAVSYEEVI